MALIQCEDCGAMISDQAKSCPKCGCPIEHDDQVEEPENRSRRMKLWILAAVIAVLAIGGGIAYLTMGKDNVIKQTLHEEPMVELTPEFCKAVRKYSCLCDFENGFAAVQNGEKWGVINTEGKEIVPCTYEMVSSFSDGMACVCKNGKWGYVNENGELAVPCVYEFAKDFSEGLASVRKNGKEGFINKKGEVAIPFRYEDCGPFKEELAYVEYKKGHYFIGVDGKIKINLPKGFSCFEGSAYRDMGIGYYPVFKDGVCQICVSSGNNYDDNYWINTNGEKITSKHSANEDTISRYQRFVGDNGLVGVKDVKTNKVVVPPKYESIGVYRPDEVIELHNGVVVATLAYKRLEINDAVIDQSENVEWNTHTEYIYGYIDLKGNETFTSEDYKLVEEKNNEFKQEESKWKQEKEKREQQNDLSWLQGTWSGYARYSKAVVDVMGDYIRVTFGNSTTYYGAYTIEDDKIVYDRKSGGYCYLLLDRDNQRIMLDENTPLSKSDEGGYSNSSNEYSSNGDTSPFVSDQDVIDYTSGKFYRSQDGMRMSIKYDGFYVNGNRTPTFAPVVTSFSGTRARIKINAIPNGTVYFTVDKSRGCIIDVEGTVWYKR